MTANKENENDVRRKKGEKKAQKKSYYGISCDRIRKAQIAVFYVWHFMKSGKTLLLLIHNKQKANKKCEEQKSKRKKKHIRICTQTHNPNHKIKEFISLFPASHSLCIYSFLIQFLYHANHSFSTHEPIRCVCECEFEWFVFALWLLLFSISLILYILARCCLPASSLAWLRFRRNHVK